MNIFSAFPRFRCNFAYFGLCIIVGLLVTGCVFNSPPATAVAPKGPKTVPIQIFVRDDETRRRLPMANVRLTIASTTYSMQQSDNNGLVVFNIDETLLNKVGELEVEIAGYQVNIQNVTVKNAETVSVWMVREGATAVPTETPTNTPIPPTLQPDDTNTPMPTDTAVPTNTRTPTATQTKTPSPTPSDGITVMRAAGTSSVFVLAGPDVSNVQLGTLGENESGEVIGRTEGNEWLQIITDRNVQGWVANCEVTPSSTDLSGITVTWSGPVTTKSCSIGGSSGSTPPSDSGSCVTVSQTHTEWPDRLFDDVLLSWSNVPSTATRLNLWVTGPNEDGETAFVIDPTFSDVDIPYNVEKFKFEGGNFIPEATYTYVVQPFNAANEIICTTQGTFVP
jgi:hypothetical protein